MLTRICTGSLEKNMLSVISVAVSFVWSIGRMLKALYCTGGGRGCQIGLQGKVLAAVQRHLRGTRSGTSNLLCRYQNASEFQHTSQSSGSSTRVSSFFTNDVSKVFVFFQNRWIHYLIHNKIYNQSKNSISWSNTIAFVRTIQRYIQHQILHGQHRQTVRQANSGPMTDSPLHLVPTSRKNIFSKRRS